jgi:hypothetical protein
MQLSHILDLTKSQSQSCFTTGGLPPISSSWRQAPWGSRSEILFFLPLNCCGHSSYVFQNSSWFSLHSLVTDRIESTVSNNSYVFFIIRSGVRLSPLGTAATTGLLYQPQMTDDGDCRATDGMKIDRGNRSTREKPAPAPLCPPQIPHDQTRAVFHKMFLWAPRWTYWRYTTSRKVTLTLIVTPEA